MNNIDSFNMELNSFCLYINVSPGIDFGLDFLGVSQTPKFWNQSKIKSPPQNLRVRYIPSV